MYKKIIIFTVTTLVQEGAVVTLRRPLAVLLELEMSVFSLLQLKNTDLRGYYKANAIKSVI